MNARPVIQAGNRASRQEEVGARLREVLENEADPDHEAEVDQDDEVVDPLQVHGSGLQAGTGQRRGLTSRGILQHGLAGRQRCRISDPSGVRKVPVFWKSA